ncbi:class B sortase [Roseburia hominis]|uniref:class B sortase n=1 Tax=Roseburia hominis TaxID=301301 RepID=UPI003AF6D5F6
MKNNRKNTDQKDGKKEARYVIIRLLFAISSFIFAMWFLYMCAAYVIQTVDESILKQKYEQAGTVTATLSDALEESIESDETAPITDAQTWDGKQLEPISSSAAAELYLKQPQKQFDHAGLSASNRDYRFWIDIPGTRISYPVVQSQDNTDYLKKNFDGTRRGSGSIFIDAGIRDYQKSRNLIIHGHDMKSGSMFGTLSSYGTLSFYNKHPFIYLYTPDSTLVYQVFAAYLVPQDIDANLVYRIAFANTEAYEAFLETLTERSVIQTGVVPSSDRQILTLSTCANRGKNRFIVHAIRYQ